MNVAIFGGFGNRMLAPGWTKETAVAILGGGVFNLTGVTPGENATLTAIAFFGGIEVVVDEGVAVTMSGFSLFGGREVTVEAGDGPPMSVRAFSFFGGVSVKSPTSAD